MGDPFASLPPCDNDVCGAPAGEPCRFEHGTYPYPNPRTAEQPPPPPVEVPAELVEQGAAILLDHARTPHPMHNGRQRFDCCAREVLALALAPSTPPAVGDPEERDLRRVDLDQLVSDYKVSLRDAGTLGPNLLAVLDEIPAMVNELRAARAELASWRTLQTDAVAGASYMLTEDGQPPAAFKPATPITREQADDPALAGRVWTRAPHAEHWTPYNPVPF